MALVAITARSAADERFPFRQQPIDYFGPAAREPVARLRERLESGDAALQFEAPRGYLLSLLNALDVPVESQVLVFSKTSVNARLISPQTPRAIYFNDSVFVGWVPDATSLEISSIDPLKGALFYTLRQEQTASPRPMREETCLLCHASGNSLHVPGHLLRSFVTDEQGNPLSGYSRIDQNNPLSQRWGGWYVTGTHGAQSHLGNLASEADRRLHQEKPAHGGNVTDLNGRVNLTRYAARHSDIVALLILDHQVTVHNLLTRVNFESRFQRPVNSEEQLVRALLFAEAPPLTAAVTGTSGYAAWYEKQGRRDRMGRSLRQLDLQTRLFKYRCSPLIYTPAFDELPVEVKLRVYRRLWDVLTGSDSSRPFATLPTAERRSILEILRETKPELPEYWTIEERKSACP